MLSQSNRTDMLHSHWYVTLALICYTRTERREASCSLISSEQRTDQKCHIAICMKSTLCVCNSKKIPEQARCCFINSEQPLSKIYMLVASFFHEPGGWAIFLAMYNSCSCLRHISSSCDLPHRSLNATSLTALCLVTVIASLSCSNNFPCHYNLCRYGS